MKEMVFTEKAYSDIMDTVGKFPAESGGILLGNRGDYIIQKFIFDGKGSTGPASYDPDVAFLNREVKKEWDENGLALLGFIHSHPRGYSRLSGDMGNGIGDIGYIKKIFSVMPKLDKFLAPIMYSSADGGECTIFPYMAERGLEDSYNKLEQKVIKRYDTKQSIQTDCKGIDESRINGAVLPKKMKKSHVVCIGVGGASGICEDLVRTGLGKLTAIDFDTVDASNLTTQGFYSHDIGRFKVDALGDRIEHINAQCNYTAIKKDFLKISEAEIARIIADADLILMMTDNFDAQKRGNLFSLKYKIPTVFAIMYERARCAEITFNIPGVTPACHRCATSSRYEAYDNGYVNTVNSGYSSVFQTHYFNAAIGMLSLAILHNSISNVEFGNWFGDYWDRNLVQLRLNNNYATMFPENRSLFEKTFDTPETIKRTFTFDAIWQTIEPECTPKYHACPDCNGEGKLDKIIITKKI